MSVRSTNGSDAKRRGTRFARWPVVGWLAFIVCGGILAYDTSNRAAHEYEAALSSHRAASLAGAERVAEKVSDAANQIYTNIRTIGSLPSVVNISRHGENIDADARMSIQQIYNNLASVVAVSEVYILPIDFDPEAIDATTSKPQEPIIMFDELITFRDGQKPKMSSIPTTRTSKPKKRSRSRNTASS